MQTPIFSVRIEPKKNYNLGVVGKIFWENISWNYLFTFVYINTANLPSLVFLVGYKSLWRFMLLKKIKIRRFWKHVGSNEGVQWGVLMNCLCKKTPIREKLFGWGSVALKYRTSRFHKQEILDMRIRFLRSVGHYKRGSQKESYRYI